MTFHVLWETCRTGVSGPAGEGDPGEWDSSKVLGLFFFFLDFLNFFYLFFYLFFFLKILFI